MNVEIRSRVLEVLARMTITQEMLLELLLDISRERGDDTDAAVWQEIANAAAHLKTQMYLLRERVEKAGHERQTDVP